MRSLVSRFARRLILDRPTSTWTCTSAMRILGRAGCLGDAINIVHSAGTEDLDEVDRVKNDVVARSLSEHVDVVVVLDPDFAGDLRGLSRGAHVWIVGSEANERAVRSVRERGADPNDARTGVTTFRGGGARDELLCEILGTIDEHHGIHAADPPWSAMRVVGLGLDEVDAARVAESLRLDNVAIRALDAGLRIER
ncbi:MAG: hypothetical protein R3F34_15495 [Planctomycetota bacterium]